MKLKLMYAALTMAWAQLGIVAEGNLRVEGGGAVPNSLPLRSMNLKPYAITADVTLTQDEHAGRLGYFDVAAGATVTLPRATGSGAKYRFFVKTTITSNSAVVKVGNADDVLQGNLAVLADGGDTLVGWEAGATADTITMDGSTKGGIRGDYIEIEDVVAGLFRVTAMLSATGTEATPLSAGVS